MDKIESFLLVILIVAWMALIAVVIGMSGSGPEVEVVRTEFRDHNGKHAHVIYGEGDVVGGMYDKIVFDSDGSHMEKWCAWCGENMKFPYDPNGYKVVCPNCGRMYAKHWLPETENEGIALGIDAGTTDPNIFAINDTNVQIGDGSGEADTPIGSLYLREMPEGDKWKFYILMEDGWVEVPNPFAGCDILKSEGVNEMPDTVEAYDAKIAELEEAQRKASKDREELYRQRMKDTFVSLSSLEEARVRIYPDDPMRFMGSYVTEYQLRKIMDKAVEIQANEGTI